MAESVEHAHAPLSTVIRVWAAVAWADGVLAEAEANSLRRLIQTAELTDAERHEAMRLLDDEVKLPEAFLENLHPEIRRGIYRAACKMAVVDRVLAPSERRILDRLRGLLAIPELLAHEIEAAVPGVT
ncbi:MAG TPA: hypothetical protein VFQ53_18985 [Kofleriaceae bacterium]|nr:hypothetical protein [Kofleriaceae bacterium]